jgi:MFS transporter, AAHS family, 4-hydroxybenzoate transporter
VASVGDVIAPSGMASLSVPEPIDVTALIDRHPMRPLQIRTVVLCGLIALLDGFDLLAIGVAAPAMAESLRIPPALLGTLFSAALLGLMLGAFALGPVADRVGRRSLLIGATAMFGVFTLSTARADNLQEVIMFRFLAGVGLGGAMPAFISLAAEYTPRPRRRQVVALLWAGFPLGGVVVGLLASWLVPTEGWRVLFLIGGAVPLGLALVLFCLLPESIAFLASQGAAGPRIRALLSRIVPDVNIGPEAHIACPAKPCHRGPRALFQHGRGRGTALLWGSYFATFLMLITTTAWAPTLLEQSGLARAKAAEAIAYFSAGSMIGTPLAGILLACLGARLLLPIALLGGAATIGALGIVVPSATPVLAIMLCAGFCLGIASSGLIAFAPLLYPTPIRSTAVGWAMGWGRAGSFAGPLAAGMFVAAGWPVDGIFAALGTPGLVGMVLSACLARTNMASRDDGTA